jgi:putative N6-adenine-specific DNA methylase
MKAVNTARLNVKAAGLSADITIEQQDFKDFTQPKEKSIIVTNPPYGERISTPDLLGTYRMIGERLKHQFMGNDAWVLSYREECFDQIGLKPSIKIPLYNGSLECEFRKYQMFDGKLKQFRSEGGVVKTEEEKRQMAQKHRFKKEREFKKRLDEQDENEESDIRSFTFHKHDITKEGKRDNRKDRRDRNDEERFDKRKDHFDKKEHGNRQGGRSSYKSSVNRGGHERFDRSGGKGKRNRFDNYED